MCSEGKEENGLECLVKESSFEWNTFFIWSRVVWIVGQWIEYGISVFGFFIEYMVGVGGQNIPGGANASSHKRYAI